MPPNTVNHPNIRISGNSGYSRRGDIVSLFVDRIDNLNDAGITSGGLALQLWACPTSYSGGALTGWKLAEHQLGSLWANHYLAPVNADVQAHLPESGDYAIVLVVAEWDGEGYNRVHDYHNYPRRDLFLHPRIAGPVSFRCADAEHIAVDAGRIESPREPDNLSGTLTLELWALPKRYHGGTFAGHALAGITLGSLSGGGSWQDCSYELEISTPPAGTYALVLMLREWVGDGYVTRDHFNLADEMTFPIAAVVPKASETAAPNAAPEHGENLEPAREGGFTDADGGAAEEGESVASKEIQAAPATPASQRASFQDQVEELQRFLKRAFEWMKKNW